MSVNTAEAVGSALTGKHRRRRLSPSRTSKRDAIGIMRGGALRR